MKELMLRNVRYNVWANKRLIDIMLKLEEPALEQEINSSYSSIKKTVLHTWSAEDIWLQRLQLTEQPVWREAGFTGSTKEACEAWQKTSSALEQFVEKQYSDKSFDHVVQYYSLKKQPFKNTVADVLSHAVNHSTYHRGQLVTMMRQAGLKEIPATDLIVYLRK